MRHPELKGDRCPDCNGSGSKIMVVAIYQDEGPAQTRVYCYDCRGTGLVNSPNACKKCKGSGYRIVRDVDNADKFVSATCGHCNGSGLEPGI
jgi:DnaJ-class molecular chaperone